ncbi:hypothetical protein NPIL_23391 [Nephila pilipes]|uniref:Uncharacterized protein n=1 Tax=Nephila pilipes TaxID=299642 RepID=A0A8X6NU88_NEPPI|nr:hypothetical protein NPIL_23391 [Nephila pilipes]
MRKSHKFMEKSAIQERLSEKKIMWNRNMMKIEFLQKFSEVKHLYKSYRIAPTAEKFDHVLRLLSYYRNFNPIEIIRSQLKQHVAKKNKTFKLNDVKDHVIQGTETANVQNWMNNINHVTEKERSGK